VYCSHPIKPDIISEIRKGILRWIQHGERMPGEKAGMKVFKNVPEEKTSVGKPRKRWLDNVGSDRSKLDAKGWRKSTRDTDAWKLIL
jgi:hypothetical protein